MDDEGFLAFRRDRGQRLDPEVLAELLGHEALGGELTLCGDVDRLGGREDRIGTAAPLVVSSADKASQESRNKLQEILDEFTVKTDAHTATGADFREVVEQSIATATPKIASASQVITDEVTAWQDAEDARIEAERVAAEEAARASYGGGSGYSGGGSFRHWIESEAAAWGVGVSYIDGNISYGSVNHVRIANVVANAGGERARMVVRHEIAHAVTYRSDNCMSAGLNTEITAQYFTMKTWGFYVDNYRAPTA
ncbi:hypothetical protein QBL02_06280 [Leucobacter sp. UT-8R-CII-1-4]|uniref:hypothetical protein n=1 Tax=Leucobacter sp. UT-8R-CII-1-4 TaxID=3040075 RepID=UPI0024A96E12|nr:hypothetical protein [Leucobacter sp. UT-8R-CII-1-4]MDI6023149.1 hypothetical protein [Leucobacter sp. UT-8R-CII-1-4]